MVLFEFKTLDITPETTVEEANEFMSKYNVAAFFVFDVSPNHKRLWITIRKDSPPISAKIQ